MKLNGQIDLDDQGRLIIETTAVNPGDADTGMFMGKILTKDGKIVVVGTSGGPVGSTGGIKGDWSATETYDVGDLVIHNGRIFVALTGANLNNDPDTTLGTDWKVSVMYDIIETSHTTLDANFPPANHTNKTAFLTDTRQELTSIGSYWMLRLPKTVNSGLESLSGTISNTTTLVSIPAAVLWGVDQNNTTNKQLVRVSVPAGGVSRPSSPVLGVDVIEKHNIIFNFITEFFELRQDKLPHNSGHHIGDIAVIGTAGGNEFVPDSFLSAPYLHTTTPDDRSALYTPVIANFLPRPLGAPTPMQFGWGNYSIRQEGINFEVDPNSPHDITTTDSVDPSSGNLNNFAEAGYYFMSNIIMPIFNNTIDQYAQQNILPNRQEDRTGGTPVVTAVAQNKYTIQLVYLDIMRTRIVYVLMFQSTTAVSDYLTKEDAHNDLNPYINRIVLPDLLENLPLVGAIVVKQSTSSLTDAGDVEYINIIGGGGGVAGSPPSTTLTITNTAGASKGQITQLKESYNNQITVTGDEANIVAPFAVNGNNAYGLPTGNYGFGTTNPLYKTHTNGDHYTSGVHLSNSVLYRGTTTTNHTNNNTQFHPFILVTANANFTGGIVLPTGTIQINDMLGGYHFNMILNLEKNFTTTALNILVEWKFSFNSTGPWSLVPETRQGIRINAGDTVSRSVIMPYDCVPAIHRPGGSVLFIRADYSLGCATGDGVINRPLINGWAGPPAVSLVIRRM